VDFESGIETRYECDVGTTLALSPLSTLISHSESNSGPHSSLLTLYINYILRLEPIKYFLFPICWKFLARMETTSLCLPETHLYNIETMNENKSATAPTPI
jgi:hypothetical protein